MADKMTPDEPGIDGKPLLDMYAQMRRRGALLIWAALLVAVVGTFLTMLLEEPPPKPDFSKLGVHLLLDDGRNAWDTTLWAEHMAYAGHIAGDGAIAVQVIRADDLDPAKWQIFVDLCAEHNLTPVMRLATTFDRAQGIWRAPQTDDDGSYKTLAQQYADFLGALNWRGLTPHVILLNEVNNGLEWGGKPDAAAYARFVLDTAPVIRAAVPDVKLLNSAFDLYIPHTGSLPFPGGVHTIDAATYLDTLFALDPAIFRQFDVWNSHVYPLGAFRQPPGQREYHFDAMHDALPVTQHPPSGIFNRGINGYEWELWKLAQFGITNMRVMITETGYRYAANAPDSADFAEDYPDESTAARYLNAALRGDYTLAGSWQPLLTDARIAGVALFALDGVPWEWAHTNLLKMNEDGSVAGTTAAYDQLASYFNNQIPHAIDDRPSNTYVLLGRSWEIWCAYQEMTNARLL